jgi:hypothetical protein
MNLLCKILYACLFAAGSIFSQQCTAELTVTSNNSKAVIYINNAIVGWGSIKKEILPGNYMLRVVKDTMLWGSESFTDSFIVKDCSDNKTFSYNFNGGVYIQSDPADSYVFSNDSLIGHTPLKLSTVHSTLRLSKPGYEDKLIDYSSLKDNNIVHLQQSGDKPEPLFIQRDLFKILVGSAVVLGGITAYFKLKADNHFDDYQFSGSQNDLDKTRQYDLISGITFGALQVNFGVLIYYFLFE